MKTHATKKEEQKPDWYIVDVEGKVLGRVATKIARVLMGKNKVNYVPYLDMGDNVVVVNAKKVAVTGKKEKKKIYYRHSGYPGALKETRLEELRAKRPTEIIRKAVYGMVPKTRLGRQMMKKLHIFAGEKHTFPNQELKELKV